MMKRSRRFGVRSLRALAVMSVAGMVGCASLETKRDAVALQPDCCAALADLPSRPLTAGATTEVRIDEASQVFSFPSGKSRFAAFDLPSDHGAEIKLRIAMPGLTNFTVTTYCPSLLFVDAEGNILEDSAVKMTWIEPGIITPGHHVAAAVVPEGARRVIVHSPRSLSGETEQIRYISMSGSLMRDNIVCAPHGKLTITLP